MTMIIKPRALTQVLSSVNSEGGVLCTMLLSNEGSLMAYTGFDNKNAKNIAAVANSIWSSFSSNVNKSFDDEKLEFIFIQCQEKNVVVSRVSNFLLCTYSTKSVEPGLLKAKVQALSAFLTEPLESVKIGTGF